MVYQAISQLITYGLGHGLLVPEDQIWAINGLLQILQLDGYETPQQEWNLMDLPTILGILCDHAYGKGLLAENTIVERDLFDTKIMGCLTPRPSQVANCFWQLYEKSPQQATDWYYGFSQATNYIRCGRVAKDQKWVYHSEYGDLDITINLSKPELDPKAIAKARKQPATGYPKCVLCRENEGYAGGLNHPARQNHRTIPFSLGGEPWRLQYSPYVYYNEHCIAFSDHHAPMGISVATFEKLLDFVTQFPHYFIGANAGLPIVGGSILSHDHFQGGRYVFAMERAPLERKLVFSGYEDVEAGTIRWPMAAVRLTCGDPGRLAALGDRILKSWRNYTDESAFVFATTKGTLHNTITPIARRKGEDYQLDLVFRNNITTQEYPLGYFHPHPELHHVKKENIGLIEVMGLAVLPARLQVELRAVALIFLNGGDLRADPLTEKHADWAEKLMEKYTISLDNIQEVITTETGKVFLETLKQASVFKRTPEGHKAFYKFLAQI